MAKNDIRDIARILSGKYKLSMKDAEAFLTAFFGTVNEGLDDDKLVKVKGFGTFKVIDVKERESVDVNTGERIKIEGRSKITFTPDSVMKDLVNKPFAQFETVALNEGVDFSDLEVVDSAKDEELAEPVAEERIVEKEAPLVEKPLVEENAPLAEESSVEENVPMIEEKVPLAEELPVEENAPLAEKPLVEENAPLVEELPLEKVDQAVHEDESTEDEDDIENSEIEEAKQRYYSRKRKKRVIIAVAFLLTTIIAFCLGYFIGRKSHLIFSVTDAEEIVESNADKVKINTPVVDIDSISKAKKDSSVVVQAKTDTIKAVKKQAEPADEVKPEKKLAEKEQSGNGEKSLAAARKMVSKGAYVIIGTEKTITVKKGQTLGKISKFYFGDGMECYLQVHNGVVEVKEGAKVKIPKLKIKKK